MKYNQRVQFVLINVVIDTDPVAGHASRVVRIAKRAPNFKVLIVSVDEFKRRCKQYLNIEIPITKENAYVKKYSYKIAEFKPALALMFPEQFTEANRDPSDPFKFWGYCDLDLIWGNFSQFAQAFQGQYAVISTNSVRLMGMATFYENQDWTKR
jgi:hypothetical protein